MATKRTYRDGCAAAHALDLVGERWALLIVRELLLGPKRFTDLRTGMPQASPNVLSLRLYELERSGIIRRRKLGPPVGARVYELTEWGHDLEPVLTHLGRWGRRSPLRQFDAEISVDALMLALRGHFDPDLAADLDATYALRFSEDHLSVRVAHGELEIARKEEAEPDAVIETDAKTFAALLTKRQRLDEAVGNGQVAVTGDSDMVDRLLDAFPASEPAPLPAAMAS